MALKLSDFLKGSLGLGFGPGVGAVGPGFSTRTQNLPNGGGSYQTPAPAQSSNMSNKVPAPTSTDAPIPVVPPVVAATTAPKPLFTGPTGPSVPVTPKPDPKAVADAIYNSITAGDVSKYAGDQFKNPTPTTTQAMDEASNLNNAGNDISTGATDPYGVASKSGIPYTPAELDAIQKAYSGIYDPAIHSALARLDIAQKADASKLAEKQKLDEMAQQFKYDIALKQTPAGGGTPEQNAAINGLPSSLTATPNTYAIEQGEDPYNIAQQNGLDIQALKDANPQIKDWKTIQPGTPLTLPFTDPSMTWLNGKTPEQIQAYNNVPDTEKADIKQLVTGGANLTDIVKSRGAATKGQIDKIITEATSIDPTWSPQRNIQRNNFLQTSWNKGQLFNQRTAIDTALAHLGTAAKTAQSVGNGDIPAYNTVINWTNQQIGQSPITNFAYDLTVLSKELDAAYNKGQTTISGTEAIYNSLSKDFSPAQFTGVAGQAATLLSGKIGAVSKQYKDIMGKYPNISSDPGNPNDNPIISIDNIQALKDAGVDTSSIEKILQKQGYNTSSLNGESTGPTPDEVAFLKSQGVSDADIAKLK